MRTGYFNSKDLSTGEASFTTGFYETLQLFSRDKYWEIFKTLDTANNYFYQSLEHRKFISQILNFQKECSNILSFILDMLHTQLMLPQAILKQIYGKDSLITMNYYPPVHQKIRDFTNTCIDSHTDKGAFVILIQDECKGLEIDLGSNHWIPVESIPGTIVIMAGDLIENLTGKKIAAVKHRVVAPNNLKFNESRCSILFASLSQ